MTAEKNMSAVDDMLALEQIRIMSELQARPIISEEYMILMQRLCDVTEAIRDEKEAILHEKEGFLLDLKAKEFADAYSDTEASLYSGDKSKERIIGFGS